MQLLLDTLQFPTRTGNTEQTPHALPLDGLDHGSTAGPRARNRLEDHGQ